MSILFSMCRTLWRQPLWQWKHPTSDRIMVPPVASINTIILDKYVIYWPSSKKHLVIINPKPSIGMQIACIRNTTYGVEIHLGSVHSPEIACTKNASCCKRAPTCGIKSIGRDWRDERARPVQKYVGRYFSRPGKGGVCTSCKISPPTVGKKY